MAYASYLYRIARSCESLEGIGRCLNTIGRQTSVVYLPRRLVSTSDDSSPATERLEQVNEKERGENVAAASGTVEEQAKQSPFVEAHLASLTSQSPATQATPASDDARASSSPDSASNSSKEEDVSVSQSPASSAARLFVFDDSTVAHVPGEQDAAEKPWDAAREAELTHAETLIKAGRPRRGATPDQVSIARAVPAAEPTHLLEPAKYDDLPEDFRPRFREIIRRRPPPMRIADVWQALREADYLGEKAKASGFVPSVDCSISLLIDPRRSDQLVRGTATLPHGTGRDARVAVFTSNASDAEAATAAGAAIVGGEELVAQVARDKGVSADVVVATPDMVPRLGKIARILGPKGLMPNPKFGTVTTQVTETVRELRGGKLQFRNDKGGTISASIGRKSFSDDALADNFYAFLRAIMDLRPRGLSGQDITGFVERVSLSTTRGKGFPVSVEDLTAAARAEHSRS